MSPCFRVLFAAGFFCPGVEAAAAAGQPAVQDLKPAGIIAADSPFATPYYIHDSGMTGPVVIVVGGIHGNEPAGAYAADQIRIWPVIKGKLIVIPKANVPALALDKRNTPGVEAAQANLNRNFPKAGKSREAIGFIAQELWGFIEKQKPEWLIDLHEGSDFDKASDKSVGSSIIIFPTVAGKEAAEEMLAAVNSTINEPEKKFTERGSPIKGSLARAVGEHLSAHAMILETTRKDQPLSLRVRQHLVMVYTLLKRLEMLDEKFKME